MNNLEIINKLEKLRKEKKYIEILKYATKEGLKESKNFDSSTLELYNEITQEAYEIFSNNYAESNSLGLENGKIMKKLVNYIFDKKYKKIIDYHNKEGKEKSLNFDKEYFLMYNIYVGASYQELGEIEKANYFFDLYLDSLEISNEEVENINKELTKKNNKKTELNKNHIKMIYLVNELNKIGLNYKVKKEDYDKYNGNENEKKEYSIKKNEDKINKSNVKEKIVKEEKKLKKNEKKNIFIKIIEILLLIFIFIFLEFIGNKFFIDDFHKYCGKNCYMYELGYDDAEEFGVKDFEYENNKRYIKGFEQKKYENSLFSFILFFYFFLLFFHYFGKKILKLNKNDGLYISIVKILYKNKKEIFKGVFEFLKNNFFLIVAILSIILLLYIWGFINFFDIGSIILIFLFLFLSIYKIK